MVWQQLRTCYDLEIPVNIVDLGLYTSAIWKPAEDGSRRVPAR